MAENIIGHSSNVYTSLNVWTQKLIFEQSSSFSYMFFSGQLEEQTRKSQNNVVNPKQTVSKVAVTAKETVVASPIPAAMATAVGVKGVDLEEFKPNTNDYIQELNGGEGTPIILRGKRMHQSPR
jgi:hypothetical protein